MTVPLTLSILMLAGCAGLFAWLWYQSQRRYEALNALYVEATRAYVDQSLKIAADMMRNQPKLTEKMLDSLARGVTQVTESLSASMNATMRAVYQPYQQSEAAATGDVGDIITPWYTTEGSMDFRDPTDAYLGGITDPISDNHQTAGGNLITEDGPSGFGLPDGAFD